MGALSNHTPSGTLTSEYDGAGRMEALVGANGTISYADSGSVLRASRTYARRLPTTPGTWRPTCRRC